MGKHVRKTLLWIATAGVALIILAVATLYLDIESTPETISASELPTVTATSKPSATPTAPAPTASPTPKPTIGYITILPTAEPEAFPTAASQRSGKEWDPSERALMIDQNAQQIYVYENGRKLKTIPCSTGKPMLDHFTPTWIGRVGEHVGTIFSFGVYADNAWQLFKASGNILIHGAPYVYVDGEKVYQDLDSLGHYPSSHGCIRVHPADADWLTAWNITGVPVIVTPWQGGFTQ